MIFIIPENIQGSIDSARYAEDLKEMHANLLSFEHLSSLFYKDTGGFVDVYQPLLTWIVAVFTDNAHVLFMLFAMVFGFFYVQNIWIIFNNLNYKLTFIIFIFLLAFALTNPIWNINGVRMWTAAQVFVFGALQYFLNKKKSGIFWCALSTIFHFSFFFPFTVLLIYLIIPKLGLVFFIFYVLSWTVNFVNIDLARNYFSYLPGLFQTKIAPYQGEAYVQKVMDSTGNYSWHVEYAKQAIKWFIFVWVIFVYFYKNKWKTENKELYNLFLFSLFIGSIAQSFALLPSGGRFLIISNSLFLAVFTLLLTYSFFIERVRFFKIATIPLLLFWVVFAIRTGFEYIGISAFIGNPISALIFEDQIPFISFIKEIF
jgi:hypothetical protein